MELTIEFIGRGGRGLEYQQVSGDRISIGRAFDNNIILSDPHVCAHHAVIEANAHGEIQLRDLDSVNGTYSGRHQAIDKVATVQSGDEFILGKCRLRIFRRDHPTPPSIRLSWVENLAHFAGRPGAAVAAVLLIMMINLYFQYNSSFKTFNISRELFTVIGMVLAIGLWPACWLLYSRTKKHDPRFVAQLTVTMLYAIILTLLQKVYHWLAFHFGLGVTLSMLSLGVFFALSLLLIWSNYYLAVFLNRKRHWAYSFTLTCLLAGLAYLGNGFDSDRFRHRPEYASRLFLPTMTFYSTRSIEQYLQGAEPIFDESTKRAEKN